MLKFEEFYRFYIKRGSDTLIPLQAGITLNFSDLPGYSFQS
jgi:hypothetical protein